MFLLLSTALRVEPKQNIQKWKPVVEMHTSLVKQLIISQLLQKHVQFSAQLQLSVEVVTLNFPFLLQQLRAINFIFRNHFLKDKYSSYIDHFQIRAEPFWGYFNFLMVKQKNIFSSKFYSVGFIFISISCTSISRLQCF